jgi:hypothetical protein
VSFRPWLAIFLAALSGCVTKGAGNRLSRHVDPEVWADALVNQASTPRHAIPEALLLVSIPLLFSEDERISEELVEHPVVSNGKERQGNVAAAGLIGLAVGTAAGELLLGDEGKSLEVLAESVLLTEGVVAVLKEVTHRRRPGNDQNTFGSFPSSHTSWSFTTATFLARRTYDAFDGPVRYSGYLAYLPAAFVAFNRVEAEKHFPTDVLAGAFLGSFFTHLIYDAHYGTPEDPGIFYQENVEVVPTVGKDFAGLTLGFHF